MTFVEWLAGSYNMEMYYRQDTLKKWIFEEIRQGFKKFDGVIKILMKNERITKEMK